MPYWLSPSSYVFIILLGEWMKFKKGDIVITKALPGQPEEDRLVFKLHSNPRLKEYEYYKVCWVASGIHIKGRYAGTLVTCFHLNNCVLYDPLGIKREVKEHKL